jgi:hypothetical protein
VDEERVRELRELYGKAPQLTVRPITRNTALPWIAEHHRHLRRAVTGWLFGIEILDGAGERAGIAIAARPPASSRTASPSRSPASMNVSPCYAGAFGIDSGDHARPHR